MKRSVLGAIAFLCMTLPNLALCDFRDSRVAYYPFSGDANDRSGNGNHLSVSGARLTTDRFDQPNSAFELDGIDDYLEKRYPSSVLNAGIQSWTVSAWIRTDDDSGSFVERYGCGWDCGYLSNLPGADYGLALTGGGTSAFWTRGSVRGNPANSVSSPSSVNDSQWHHIVGVSDRGTGKHRLYVDGVLIAEIDNVSNTPLDDQTGTPLSVGRQFRQHWDSSVGYFRGKVDDISIFNSALTAEEVAQLKAERFLPDITTGRVAYYPFSGDANDLSGNGNHLSVSGARLTTDRFEQPDSAFELDGIDDYLERRYPSSALNASMHNWTVSAWIKTDDDLGSVVERYGCGWDCGYLSNLPGADYGIAVSEITGNASFWTRGNIRGNPTNSVVSPFAVNDSQWHHLVGVSDRLAGKHRLYVDGVLVAETNNVSYTSLDDQAGTPLSVGRQFRQHWDSSVGYFEGKIDDISIYDRALNDKEVEELYGSAPICSRSSLVVSSKTVSGKENEPLQFSVSANPTTPKVRVDASNLPSWATFDGKTIQGTPGFDDAGSYEVIFTVSNGCTPPIVTSDSVTIVVGNENRPPQLNPLASQQANEGGRLQFTVTATDPDGDSIRFQAGNLPPGATFDEVTGAFQWDVGFDAAGNYSPIFTALDGESSDSQAVEITVGNVNQKPRFELIGTKSAREGDELTFVVSAIDGDNDALTYTASNLPQGATFNPTTQRFSWIPTFSQSGNYSVDFLVEDNGEPSELDTLPVPIVVGDVNRLPIIREVGNFTVESGDLLSFFIEATDLDGDEVTLSTSTLPSGASFDPTGGTFSWRPTRSQVGVHSIRFYAHDGKGSQEMGVVITVGQAPTPAQQIRDIYSTIVNKNLPDKAEKELLKPLLKAQDLLDSNKIERARQNIEDFMVEIEQARSAGVISDQDATQLRSAAQKLLSDIA